MKTSQRVSKNDSSEESENFNKFAWIYLICLRLIGILPFEGQDYKYFLSSICLTYFQISKFFNSAMNHSNFIINLRLGVIDIGHVCEVVILFGIGIRYILMSVRRQEYNALVVECRKIWTTCSKEEHLIMHDYERKLRILFNGFIGSCVFLHICYTGVSLKKCLTKDDNGTNQKVLPYRWFVNETPESPWFELAFLLQVLMSTNDCLLVSTMDSAAPFLIIISCGYFRILQNRLLAFKLDTFQKDALGDDSETYEQILSFAKFHRLLLKLSQGIDNFTRSFFFIQFIGTGYNLSLIGIKLLGTDPDRIKYVPLISLCFVQLLICQYAPDLLIDESEAVSTVSYFAYTPYMSSRTSKLLTIMLNRAQIPAVMKAGGMINMSLETFGNMIKSAISFFTVLRSFNV